MDSSIIPNHAPSTEPERRVPTVLTFHPELPEAPPTYFDFPPIYTVNSGDVNNELPAYSRKDPVSRNHRARNIDPLPTYKVCTVLPIQEYAYPSSRNSTDDSETPYLLQKRLRRRSCQIQLVGTLFFVTIVAIVLSMVLLMAFLII